MSVPGWELLELPPPPPPPPPGLLLLLLGTAEPWGDRGVVWDKSRRKPCKENEEDSEGVGSRLLVRGDATVVLGAEEGPPPDSEAAEAAAVLAVAVAGVQSEALPVTLQLLRAKKTMGGWLAAEF